MEYTPNPELEKLRTEKEQNEKKVEQLDHRIQRLENRIKYYQDGDRKRRTHRLCTIAGTLESIAPEIKELDITEVMELLEHIFHKEEIQKLVHRMKINHDSKVRRAKGIEAILRRETKAVGSMPRRQARSKTFGQGVCST